jgi:hypothetical protein
MEVLHILRNHIAGSDVSATAKPPLARHTIPVFSLKVPESQDVDSSREVSGATMTCSRLVLQTWAAAAFAV